MSDQSEKDASGFVERIAAILRRPERLDDSFEDRLVAVLRADAGTDPEYAPATGPRVERGWWRRTVTIQFAPLTGLAAAAACAAIISLATLGLTRGTRPVSVVQRPPDTVHVVRFVFVDRAARTVSLVGDFNAWQANRTSLAATGENGAWTISVPLSRGRHEYAFIVDGKRWVPDPFATPTIDEFDTSSSVITVGD